MNVLSVTSLLCVLVCTVTSQATDQATQCEKGWTYFRHHCYLVKDEYETFEDADDSCGLIGASLAFGVTKDDINFLTTLVGKQNHFSYWYGAQVRIYDKPPMILLKNERGYYSDRSEKRYGFRIKLPPLTTYSAPNESRCIGLQETYIGNSVFMMGLSCNLLLPYICRGDLSVLPKKPDSHYTNVTQGDQDVYWLSDVTDRKSYKDAVTACKAKSMTLASIRDTDQKDIIHRHVRSRTHTLDGYSTRFNLDPWWVGLQASKSQFSWSDGVAVREDVLNWSRFPKQRYNYVSRKSLLLFDGTLAAGDYSIKAPFICSRFHTKAGRYGCPVSWSRAGQSCYKQSESNLFSQTKAQGLCRKIDARLITFDTVLEKEWVRSSMFLRDKYIWTSLTDTKKRGDYVWADGSKPSASVVTWGKMFTIRGAGDCVVYKVYSRLLYLRRCNGFINPGCQYKPKNGQCANKDWFYNNGNCYYIPRDYSFRNRFSYGTMLHFCYKILQNTDPSVEIQPLKLDSKAVMDELNSRRFNVVWTGLKFKNGELLWADGTPLDNKLFGEDLKQPYLGTKEQPNHCVVASPVGTFETRNCDKSTAYAVCEKHVPYTTGRVACLHTSPLLVIWALLFVFYIQVYIKH